MEEYMTKRGRITFGTERIMMEESITGYLKNSFKGFWKKGGLKEQIFLMSMIGLFSFSASFLTVSFYYAPITAKIDTAALILAVALAIMIYEHWNNVDRDKFISYEQINYVEHVEGMTPFTCTRFIVKYDKNNEERTRYVVMPTDLMPGTKDRVEEIKNSFEEKDVRVI